jgi:hypothetical protein
MLYQLVHDSFTGRFVRYISRGRIFPYHGDHAPSVLKRFSAAEEGSDEVAAAAAEEGKDPLLVGWYGPDDPEVRLPVEATCCKSEIPIADN